MRLVVRAEHATMIENEDGKDETPSGGRTEIRKSEFSYANS